MKNSNITNKERRNIRTKARIRRFSDRVRLSIFRSNKYIWAQLITLEGKTLATIGGVHVKDTKAKTKTEKAFEIGQLIAKKALEHKINNLVFDRGPYKYHGRVKAVCEGARSQKINI